MLVTLAYCLRDQDITLKLFNWIATLGGCKPRHSLRLIYDARCPQNVVQSILDAALPSFEDVRYVKAQAQIDGWPEGANYMFRTATAFLCNQPVRYFLWLEPDAIPLKPGWLDLIEDEYLRCGKPFMGDRVEVDNIPLHMSGVGIYPNPIYHLAGEAYRAADTAWDMAAKDQIVPNAYFTDLIEHAWKHPTFTSLEELKTQIDPKAVLFHASKDGSLISLLEQQRSGAHAAPSGVSGNVCSPGQGSPPSSNGEPISPPLHNLSAAPVLAEPNAPTTVADHAADTYETVSNPLGRKAATARGEARESTLVTRCAERLSRDSRGGVQTLIYDIFIRTYPVDYPWLAFCLRSIRQYATGFRKVWIISPEPYPGEPWDVPGTGIEIEWKVLNEESEDGYLSQQIHKLYADVITDYQADYILHIDSDTLFTRPVTPHDFFQDDKLIWYYTPYEATDTPWKPITEKFMNCEVKNEFMRRLPMMVPKWLYAKLREFCWAGHHQIISDYIKRQPYREFSEFNALGAYAWEFHRDKFHWVNTLENNLPAPFARQFYSWGGLTEEVKAEIQTILSGGIQPEENSGGALGIAEMNTPAQNTPEDGYESPGDHVRWLANYCKDSHSRRQYVMNQLAKYNLKMLRRGRRKKQKETT